MPAKRAVAFHASNYHVASCGKPPAWTTQDSASGERRFYAENEHGEQLVASASRELFRLINADLSWESELRVENPDYLTLVEQLEGPSASLFSGPAPFGGLVMTPSEKHWIRGVLLAAASCFRREPPAPPSPAPKPLDGPVLEAVHRVLTTDPQLTNWVTGKCGLSRSKTLQALRQLREMGRAVRIFDGHHDGWVCT